ncbi:hypothetical protein GWI33_010605 [Rhynchophorus ferrugineus]|uniref:Peptidase M14 domain-containing protein n=1 Tax=Rhynchophorus ferrugineus TaxID=354439 RepID=A0A834J1U3_RHYFE|nr:hypothetical protein GWI33_010605 [Rhynchophorus ferrugineus]
MVNSKKNKKKPSRGKSRIKIKEDKKQPSSSNLKVSVERQTLSCRRYEEYYDHILSYDKIIELLRKIQKRSSGKVDIVEIGKSTKEKPIYMAIISTPSCKVSSEPKFTTFIAAGLNGTNFIAVSNALFMIDFLTHNQNFITIMDYYIVPCCNPDSYDTFVRSKEPPDKKIDNSNNRRTCPSLRKRQSKLPKTQSPADTTKAAICVPAEKNESVAPMDLTFNFPVILGINDMRNIPTDLFKEKIVKWKENYLNKSPEAHTLLKTIYTYQFVIKLLISLQEGGESICYPHGFCRAIDTDTSDLQDVGKRGQRAICNREFSCGSIYDIRGLTYGTLIDFLKVDKLPIKYLFDIQVHKKTPKYNEQCELTQLLRYGNDMMNCVKRMSSAVFKFYSDVLKKKEIDTKVKLR